jgi:hypothetical protein
MTERLSNCDYPHPPLFAAPGDTLEWQSLLENAVSDQERALGADQGHDPSTA